MKNANRVSSRVMALALLVLFLAAAAAADVIKDNSFQAASNGINVTLRWITDDETNVARFEIQRRSGIDGAFMTIASVDPKGPSLYEFVDNTAFRKVTALYQYRIAVIYNNGAQPFYTSAVSVMHTVSGVRRTWGSIKAMFR